MDEIEETTVGIPESVIINGVTYTLKDTPELQKFAQAVAKVEKTKLYSQMDSLKRAIDSLKSAEIVPPRIEGSSIDEIINKMKGTFITKEDLKVELPLVIKEVVQPVLSATENNRLEELRQYRESLINANAATCIPELVKGDTKEELDASLAESIRIRAQYPSPVATTGSGHVTDPLIAQQAAQLGVQMGGAPTPTPTPAPAPQPTPQAPAPTPTPAPTPFRAAPEATNAPDVKKMTASEFARNRESLEQQLRAMYGG